MGSLICAAGAGADFGLGAGTDVCRSRGPCPVDSGHRDYCRLCGPCAFGEGDCDLDRECQAGLTCLDDVGEDYGTEAYIDVCGQAANTYCPLEPGHPDYCGACGPCDVGEGNCDSSRECNQSFLECVQGVGAQHGYSSDTNVCLVSTFSGECGASPGHRDFCAACGLCDVGEGDCDGDRECRPGLTCADGAGAEFGLDADTDVCVERSTLAAPGRLRAKILSPTEVRLRWRHKSPDEDSFQVQKRRASKKRFQKAATTGANVKKVVLGDLEPGASYVFRVRAMAGGVKSEFSNQVTVTLPTG